MIRKNLSGLSPNFELSVDGVAVDYQSLNRVKVFLSENKHDVLTLELAGIPTRAITDYHDQAVQFHLDTGASYSCDFVGYVVDVQPEAKSYQSLVNDSPFQTATLQCFGVSYAMRGAKSKVWDGYTLSGVAGELATTYGFSLDVPKDSLIYSPLVQAQESDWQFLVRYCKLLGYSISVHGTHMHIYDPFKASDRAVSFNRLLTIRGSQGDSGAQPGLISEFKGSFSEHHADGLYKNTTVTVRQGTTEFDVSTQEIRGVVGTPRFENRINEYVPNYERAVRVIDAASKHEYDYQATAVVAGLAGCVPGGVVQLDNYNSNFDGLWYVSEITHSLTSGAFTSTLLLVRNKTNQLTQFSRTEKFTLPPASQLVKGRWEAVKRKQHEYV